MGDLPGPNMEISDFYCSSGNKGYVIPWDAADRINEMSEPKVECLYGRHCIGIVVGVGQHDNDFSDYSDSGIYAEREIKEKSCHGYAMALTDSGAQVEWAKASTPGAKLVGTYNHDFPERAIFDWNGFYNYQKIEEFIINSTTHTSLEDFPAENACRNYGNDCGLSAPGNTTGWFLPSAGMIDFVWKKNDDIKTALTKDNKMSALLAERFATIKNYLEDDWVYKTGQYTYIDNIKGFDTAWSYWTSNEENSHTLGKSAYYVNIERCFYVSKSNKTTTSPTKNITVRTFLAF